MTLLKIDVKIIESIQSNLNGESSIEDIKKFDNIVCGR